MFSLLISCSQEFHRSPLDQQSNYVTRGSWEKKRQCSGVKGNDRREEEKRLREVHVSLAAERPEVNPSEPVQDVRRSALLPRPFPLPFLFLHPFFCRPHYLPLPNLTIQPAGQNRDCGH